MPKNYWTTAISDKKDRDVQNSGYRLMVDQHGQPTYRDHPQRPPVKIAAFTSAERATEVAKTLIGTQDVPAELTYIHTRPLEEFNPAYQVID